MSIPPPPAERLLDMTSLKALAHPLRIQLLDTLSMYGSATASGLAERLGESSGATSYHLRQLEKHGFVREDAARGTARERWWERVPLSIELDPIRYERGTAERTASDLIADEWQRSRESAFRDYLKNAESVFGKEWIDAGTSMTINTALTVEELTDLVADLDRTVRRHIDPRRGNPSRGSRPVQLQLNAFPLVGGRTSEQTAPDVGGSDKNS